MLGWIRSQRQSCPNQIKEVREVRAICPRQSTLRMVKLRCRKCGLLFITKNIEYVGARTIFPEKEDCEHGLEDLDILCPKKPDIKSFQEELALFESQGRSKEEVERIFKDSYGKTPQALGLTYK